jgi:F-type H+-transporting ATPase subunit b
VNINATLLGQAIWFGLFIWITMKYVWPPLQNAMQTRQKQIADGLAAADQGNRSLEDAQKKISAMETEARAQAMQIVASGEKQRSETVERAKSEALAEAEKVKAGKMAELEQEIQRAKAALREQVAALAVAGAEQILKREVNAQAHADLLGQLKTQL